MIVYGDQVIRARLGEVLDTILSADSRTSLIVAGQLEQALEDQGHDAAAAARKLTDACAAWFGTGRKPDLHPLAANLQRSQWLWIKIPEGYNSYGVYPEQYLLAATRFCLEHLPVSVLVIGIRTIGTSLSAVVQEALQPHCQAERLTVRPAGDPYNREVDAGQIPGKKHEWALVVDEGPGRSGSSFAAVARELLRLGYPFERIVFFPGHDGPPGPDAAHETLELWSRVRRYHCSIEDRLKQELVDRSKHLLDCQTLELQPLQTWPRPTQPPIYHLFERPLLKATANGRSIVWTFYGLDSLYSGAAHASTRYRVLARHGAAFDPASEPVFGYLPLLLPDGLVPTQPSTSEVAAYLRHSRPAAEVDVEPERSIERLAHMAYWNAHKGLGPDAATKILELTPKSSLDPVFAKDRTPWTGYADGRLMRWNWARTPEGKLLKIDPVGHSRDHTVVGTQQIWWDIVGAEVELGIPAQNLVALLDLEVDGRRLDFYRAAYLAFWLGMASMCDGPRHELKEEFVKYESALRTLLFGDNSAA